MFFVQSIDVLFLLRSVTDDGETFLQRKFTYFRITKRGVDASFPLLHTKYSFYVFRIQVTLFSVFWKVFVLNFLYLQILMIFLTSDNSSSLSVETPNFGTLTSPGGRLLAWLSERLYPDIWDIFSEASSAIGSLDSLMVETVDLLLLGDAKEVPAASLRNSDWAALKVVISTSCCLSVMDNNTWGRLDTFI